MAAVTVQMVKELRERTDLPMMECKQALTECDGNVEAAREWLRKKHKGKLAERTDRVTGEGRIGVYVAEDKKSGGFVELQCETAAVANNELFVELANEFARKVVGGAEASPNADDVRKDPEMDAKFTDVFGKMRENMQLTRCRRVHGEYVAAYVHHDGKSGTLLALDGEPQSDKNVGGDLCMHALFTKPVAVDRAGIPAERVERVRNEAIEMAKTEGKPEQIVAKIAEGKVNAFYGQHVLMEQLHVKTDDYGKTKVGEVLKAAGVNAVTDLVIMKVGG
jgi:elongation factor Ts